MTDPQRRWDRRTTESDPAYEAFAAYLDTGSLRDAYRQRSGNEKATPSHRRDSQSASRHAAIREQRQRLREHLIHPGVLARTSGVDISGNAGRPPPATQEALMSQGGPSVRQVGVSGSSSGRARSPTRAAYVSIDPGGTVVCRMRVASALTNGTSARQHPVRVELAGTLSP